MDRDELTAWLRLVLTPHVGPKAARKLLASLASPQAIFAAPASALQGLVSSREAKSLAVVPAELHDHLERTLAWLQASGAGGEGARAVLTPADTRYPPALLHTADPPLVLFAQGRLDLLTRPAVAVVGSRSPSAQGRDNAFAFSRALSAAGVAVVSGLAQGVDGAAHEGALDGVNPNPPAHSQADSSADCNAECSADSNAGSTIAVVGTGLDRVYPKSHLALAHRLSVHGLMLSEFLLGTPPMPSNFPKRNRIVAGLARGTLVVEAAVQSGSLITARLAAEMGREVLAIPGSIHSPQARGCHALIKQGAKLVETAQDVLDELHLDAQVPVQSTFMPNEDESGDPLLAAMGFDPVSQEALSARTGMGPAELGVKLLELELTGQVARLPGQLFQRMGQA